MPRFARQLFVAAILGGVMTACGDAPTSDHRGYTKAPLERPGMFIKPEQPSNMRQFARLNMPDGQPVVLNDSSASH